MVDSFDRLRLIRSANVGPVGFRQLLARFGSAAAALEALPALARRGGGRAPRLAGQAQIEQELQRLHELGAQLLFLASVGLHWFDASCGPATPSTPGVCYVLHDCRGGRSYCRSAESW